MNLTKIFWVKLMMNRLTMRYKFKIWYSKMLPDVPISAPKPVKSVITITDKYIWKEHVCDLCPKCLTKLSSLGLLSLLNQVTESGWQNHPIISYLINFGKIVQLINNWILNNFFILLWFHCSLVCHFSHNVWSLGLGPVMLADFLPIWSKQLKF